MNRQTKTRAKRGTLFYFLASLCVLRSPFFVPESATDYAQLVAAWTFPFILLVLPKLVK